MHDDLIPCLSTTNWVIVRTISAFQQHPDSPLDFSSELSVAAQHCQPWLILICLYTENITRVRQSVLTYEYKVAPF